jgi:hypothetical protein
MTPLKRLSLKFLLLAALLISSAAFLQNTKAAKLCCSTCPVAVNSDLRLCNALRAQANKCGIYWVQDPCRVQPAQVCISGCTCDQGC